jgi:hypothetical protein
MSGKRGRPKTAVGHRDDAASGLHEGMASLARLRAVQIANRRREDRMLREVASELITADRSWRRARAMELAERECGPTLAEAA